MFRHTFGKLGARAGRGRGRRVAPWLALVLVLVNAWGALSAGARAQPAPPSPGLTPPNASRVIALVTGYHEWPDGLDQSPVRGIPTSPAWPPGEPLYALALHIISVEAATPDLESLAVAQLETRAYALTPLPADAVGRQVSARIELIGGTRGVAWLISEIIVLPAPDEEKVEA